MVIGRHAGPHGAQVELVFVEDAVRDATWTIRLRGGSGVAAEAEPPSPCLKLIKIIR